MICAQKAMTGGRLVFTNMSARRSARASGLAGTAAGKGRPSCSSSPARPHYDVASRRAGDVRPSAFFKFGGASAEDNELASCREDYSLNDASDYYDYMGLLAVYGDYERFDSMVESGLDPVDIILCMAVEEGDKPKIESLMETGADASVVHPIIGKKVSEIPEDEEIAALLR